MSEIEGLDSDFVQGLGFIMARRFAGAAQDEKIQLRDIACTLYGFCMENKIPSLDCEGIIVTLPTSTTPYKKIITDAAATHTDIFRYNMGFSQEELDLKIHEELAEPKIRCLFVGFATRDPKAIPKIAEKNKELDQRTKVLGVSRPNNIIQWDEAEPPLMVVTPVTAEKPEQTKLYALLKPEEAEASAGLWKPYTISQDYVFYRSRYRTNATNVQARKKEWTQMILNDSVRPGYGQIGKTQRQNFYRRARQEYPVIVRPNESLANEALALTEMYHQSKDPSYLKDLLEIFERLDSELIQDPAKNSSMHKFIEIEADFNEQDVYDFCYDMSQQYQDVGSLEEDHIRRLRNGLQAAKVELPYRLLYSFIRLGVHRMKKRGGNDTAEGEADKQLASDTAEDVAVTHPEPKSTPSMTVAKTNALLQAVRNRIREIVEAGDEIEGNFRASLGDLAVNPCQQWEGTILDAFEGVRQATDLDSLRLAYRHSLIFMGMKDRRKNAGLQMMAKDLLFAMNRLRLGDEAVPGATLPVLPEEEEQ